MSVMDNVVDAKAHQHESFLSADGHAMLHASRINQKLALLITRGVGSMWCAYVFCAIAMISAPAALTSGNVLVMVSWFAQTFLQLVLLPVIIVGQNVSSKASDARAQADHLTLSAIHTLSAEIHTINEQQTLILQQLERYNEQHG